MEFGIQLRRMDAAKTRDLAQTCEGLGFDLILFPDHIIWEGPERQYNPHDIVYDSIGMATAVAAATNKVRIGHMVLCNMFRHPVITAQALMTLDHVSNGRAFAGLGAGWTQTEFEMTGIPFPPIAERLRMLDESLTCLRLLWTQERTTYDGEFYKLRDAIMWPKPIQKPHPPIIVGGGRKGALRIAAKHADYVNIIPDFGSVGKGTLEEVKRLTDESFRAKLDFVRKEARRNGRDSQSLQISNFFFLTMLTDSREASRQVAAGIAPAFGLPAEQLSADDVLQSPMMLIGTPDECVTELKRRVKEWGVSQFVFVDPVADDAVQLRRFHDEVLAHMN